MPPKHLPRAREYKEVLQVPVTSEPFGDLVKMPILGSYTNLLNPSHQGTVWPRHLHFI